MNILDTYMQSKQAIFEHVGYDGDDEANIVDYTQYYWTHNYSTVRYSTKSEDILNHLLIDTIHRNRVYEGDDFTLIVIETEIGGSLEFRIFDTLKEINIDG